MSTEIGIYKICENPWNLWDNISQAACGGVSHRCHRFTRMWMRRRHEICRRPTDRKEVISRISRIYTEKIRVIRVQKSIESVCIRGICGRIISSSRWCSPTDIADLHGYWVRRSLPQIARMSTEIGIYKICENLWNLWENKPQAANDLLPQNSQNLTDQDFLCVKNKKRNLVV